ncbi:MAG: hypothetical protein AB8F74_17415, partial [Saprospiraceae bacterium]
MNTKAKFLLDFLFSCLLSISINAQDQNHDHSHNRSHGEGEPLTFIPNQNQWHSNIKYQTELGGMNMLYLEEKSLTYLFHDQSVMAKMHDNRSIADTLSWQSHAYKIHFVGAKKSSIKGIDKQSVYHNYLLGKESENWASKVPVFHGVSYEELYEGIQMKAYSKDGNFKYDFILAPGADPSDIQLYYEGADQLELKNGALHIKASIENITEHRPFAFQEIDGKTQVVPCEYHLDNNTLTFD